MKLHLNRIGRKAVFFVLLAFISTGCATYGTNVKKSLDFVKQGKYTEAEKNLKEALKPDGNDRLLYYLELGTLTRLDKRFSESNNLLNTADRISDDLYTTRGKDVLKSMLLNPKQAPYSGSEFETAFLNYYKTLNYMDLSFEKPEDKKALLDNAMVELRRLDYKLHSYEVEKGNYKEVKDKEKKTFVKLLNLFKKFQGNWLNEDWLKFREDAYARYIAGVVYELSGNYSDARISYEKSAKIYESGYAKQYSLDRKMIKQAWYDAVRMMIKMGGWEHEWQGIAKRHLGSSALSRLKKYAKSKSVESEIVVVEHLGFAPRRKELNLILKANPVAKSIYLHPILTGSPKDRNDQRAWFFLLYSDKGVLDIIKNYSSGGLGKVARGLKRKTIGLGPAWKLAENIGLIQAIGKGGLRVTVPYYPPFRSTYGLSEISIDGKRVNLLRGESIADIALQNQLLNAGSDLNKALARAALKNVIAFQANKQMKGGDLGLLAGKIFAAATSAAETRNWLMLPQEIRLGRLPVKAGTHQVQIVTKDRHGNILSRETKTIEVKSGEKKVWVKRVIAK